MSVRGDGWTKFLRLMLEIGGRGLRIGDPRKGNSPSFASPVRNPRSPISNKL